MPASGSPRVTLKLAKPTARNNGLELSWREAAHAANPCFIFLPTCHACLWSYGLFLGMRKQTALEAVPLSLGEWLVW